MPDFLLLRHAPTDWNAAKRIQGRADVPLSQAGRRAADTWRLPDWARGWPAFASPLARATATAEAMGLAAQADPRFTEMDWGGADGLTLAELRARGGAAFAANEAHGLDFRPAPNGESPRETGERALEGLRRLGADAVVVTHKGVLRALLALACDWDMTARPPVRIEPACAQHFRLGDRLTLVAANIPLVRKEAP